MPTPPTHPQWPIADALERAREAARIVSEHDAAITPLLPANLLARLVADRALLGDESAVHAMTVQKTATGAKHDAIADGHDLVMVVRDIVKTAHAPEEILRAVGVGEVLEKKDATKTAAALASIVEHGDALLAFGVAPQTIEEAKALAAAIGGKKDTQDGAKTAKRTTTEQRHDAHLRIEAAVRQIVTRGVQAFRKDPAMRERLAALLSHAHQHAAEGAPAGAGPAQGQTPKS